MWGIFPLYWTILEPAGAFEILAHRVVWSLFVMAALVVLLQRRSQFVAILRDRRTCLLLIVAAVVIGVNWGGYIWGVNNGYVVETSLGYFINPLVTVLLGVVVLHERLRRLQWAALGIAFVAVGWLAVAYGRPPWIALVLAGSFGTYGLAKKQAGVGAVEGLTVETIVLVPLALVYLGRLHVGGDAAFGQVGLGHALLLAGTGVVTAIPLLCFGAAATRIPLTTIGLLQYIAPVAQFALGVLVFREEMSTPRWGGFMLVWIALIVLTAESLRHRHYQLRRAAEAAAV